MFNITDQFNVFRLILKINMKYEVNNIKIFIGLKEVLQSNEKLWLTDLTLYVYITRHINGFKPVVLKASSGFPRGSDLRKTSNNDNNVLEKIPI